MDKPYHHIYKNGKLFAFKNPEGGPKRNPNFKWNWKVFSEEKKKLKINYPPEHVINKKNVLENLEKFPKIPKIYSTNTPKDGGAIASLDVESFFTLIEFKSPSPSFGCSFVQ